MTVQNVIIFFGGVAVGALGASIVLKDRYKTRYRKEADEKCASMQEYVDKLRELDKKGEMIQNLQYMGKEPDIDVETEARTAIAAAKALTKNAYNTLYSGAEAAGVASVAADFLKQSAALASGQMSAEEYLAQAEYPTEDYEESGEVDSDEETENWDETQMKKESIEKRKAPPEVIQAYQFDDHPWHDKVELTLYSEDGVLTESISGEPVFDGEDALGDCLETSGFLTNDEDELYVRNWQRGTDYYIVKAFAPYMD